VRSDAPSIHIPLAKGAGDAPLITIKMVRGTHPTPTACLFANV
jgi:hypothetical protein